MKKSHSLALAGVIALIGGLLTYSGANAVEGSDKNNGDNKNNPNNVSQEFKSSGIRSHGHPIANLTGIPSPGSSQDAKSYETNDDATSELNWQIWNKVNREGSVKISGSTASNPIRYHSGGALHVYNGAVQIIPVWVGTWTVETKALWALTLSNLVTSLIPNNLATSGHVFNTNLGYFTSTPPNVAGPTLSWSASGTAAITTTTKDGYGLYSVSDANVATYINSAIKNMAPLAPGVRPIYVYMGAANTRLSSGFGTAYCGWHSIGTLNSITNIPYIAIQDFPSTFNSACSAQSISPNGNVAMDAMASVLVHEIDETLSDPDLVTWYDNRGAENGDKCAWTFGVTTFAVNGAKYNFTAGGTKYLIQRNWLANNKIMDVVAGTACVLYN